MIFCLHYYSIDILQYSANLSIPLSRIATTNISEGVNAIITDVSVILLSSLINNYDTNEYHS